MTHSRQRGVALLVAIVIFAIATTVAAAITYSKAMSARRAAATFTMEQSLQAGGAAEALASIVLEDNASKTKTQINDDWAKPLGPVEIEGTGIWIAAQLEDLSGRFNLNSVVKWDPGTSTFVFDDQQTKAFQFLLESVDVEPEWADKLVDWIDTDNAPYSTYGGEDTLYLSQNPPYRPPNTFIRHASELLALPGFGAERYAKLAPYVTALPYLNKVNICTARASVLEATRTEPNQTVEYTDAMLEQQREKGCFPVPATYLANIADQTIRADVTNRIDERSSWFRLRTHIRVGTAEFVLYSVLHRDPMDNRIRATQRSFGSE